MNKQNWADCLSYVCGHDPFGAGAGNLLLMNAVEAVLEDRGMVFVQVSSLRMYHRAGFGVHVRIVPYFAASPFLRLVSNAFTLHRGWHVVWATGSGRPTVQLKLRLATFGIRSVPHAGCNAVPSMCTCSSTSTSCLVSERKKTKLHRFVCHN